MKSLFKFPWACEGFVFGAPGGIQHLAGTGSPESVVTAPPGSTYVRTDGVGGAKLYQKDSGTGSTGWKLMASAFPGAKRAYTTFNTRPIAQTGAASSGVPTGVTGDVNLLSMAGQQGAPGITFEYFILGTQTILKPVLVDGGLDFGFDQTNADGVQFDTGITTQNPLSFTTGTDACYIKLTAKIADASGVRVFAGFKALGAARNADYKTWSDYAVIGNVGGADPGPIKTETAKANVGVAQVVTDTTNTWADAATHTLEVYVSAAGAVTYKIDGAAPTAVAAFSFTAATVIVPVFEVLQLATSPSAVVLSLFDCGLQGALV